MREATLVAMVLLLPLAAGAALPAPSAPATEPLGPAAAGAPEVPRVGLGHPSLDLPRERCSTVSVNLVIEGPQATVAAEQFVLSEAPRGGQTAYGLRETPRACGAPTRYYAELVLNATRARDTCAGCASARAQVWLDDGPSARAGDFSYVVLRGSLWVHDSTQCRSSFDWCNTRLTVWGVEGTVELLDAPPPVLLGPLAERPRP